MHNELRNGAFFGNAARPREIGGVTLAETAYEAGFVVPRHSHSQPIFCLGVRGRFTEHASRAPARLGPRALFFHPAGEPHAESFDGPARLFNVQLGARWLERMADYDVRLPQRHTDVEQGRLAMLGMQLHTEYRRGGPAAALAVDGLILTMLAELTRAGLRRERGRPAWIDTVIDALRARSAENLGLAELAALVQVHPSHLAHAFRTHVGCTVGAYVRGVRVERARAALRGTELPIARVAALAGFADQSHLTRVFRAATGLTPAAYRRLMR